MNFSIFLISTLWLMPPNPYRDVKMEFHIPKMPKMVDRPARIAKVAGAKRALVILLDFSDNSYTYPKENFDSLVYGTTTKSMTNYYKENSYGKFWLDQTSQVTQWQRASQNYSYFVGDSFGIYSNYPNNSQGLVYEACRLIDGFVDFRQFDENSDGLVDNIFIVHAGPGAEETGNTHHIWSHKWQLSDNSMGCPGPYQTQDGVRVDEYSTEPEKFYNPSAFITIGVFVHEFGHQIGLPDLYDTDYSSNGIGTFCLMAAGSWARASTSDLPGSSPVHICAWGKYQLGWVTPIGLGRYGVKEMKNAPVPAIASDSTCYRMLEDPFGPDWNQGGSGRGEYFMVENRYKTGYDKGLPGNGLLILHIDDSRTTNSEDRHPIVGIMQADGDESPTLSDRGTDADLWKNSSYGFGDTSRPSSYDYYGSPSGVWIYNISNAESLMRADLWVAPVLLGKVYSYPNPYVRGKVGHKLIITYVPSDTAEFINKYPPFKVVIYNLAGEKIRTLEDNIEVDRYSRRASWDLKNDAGDEVTSGLYFYLVESTIDNKVERNKGRLTVIR